MGMRGKGKRGLASSFGGMSETVLYHRPKTVIHLIRYGTSYVFGGSYRKRKQAPALKELTTDI